MCFRTYIIYAILIGLGIDGHAGQTVKPQKDNTIYKPVPINIAEAIIEPFWSPGLSGLDKWTVNSGEGHGLRIKQNWDVAYFEWASRPAQGPALRMYRDFNIDCAGYDRLLVHLTAPSQSILRITAITDRGRCVFKSKPSSENTVEHSLDLQGAKLIKTIILEIEAKADGPGAGWFSWIGLQNTEQLSKYFALWD